MLVSLVPLQSNLFQPVCTYEENDLNMTGFAASLKIRNGTKKQNKEEVFQDRTSCRHPGVFWGHIHGQKFWSGPNMSGRTCMARKGADVYEPRGIQENFGQRTVGPNSLFSLKNAGDP